MVNTFNNRVTWIDFFKGLGILLVVIGHSNIPKILTWWIWSFHMPMFFFVSGFLFIPKRNPSFLLFLSKRVKMLLIPYFIYSIFIMFCFSSQFFKSDFKIEATSYIDFVNVLLYGWHGLALWFIPVLFLTEIIFFSIKKRIDNNYFLIVILLIFSVLGYYLGENDLRIAYKLEVVPMAVVFYGFGYVSQSYISNFIEKRKNGLLLILAAVLLTINVAFCFINNQRLDMCYNKMGNYIYTYISAIAGFLFMLLLSVFLSQQLRFSNPITIALNFLGRNTLIILLLHQLIKIYLNLFIVRLPFDANVTTVLKHIFFWISMVIIIKIINKYLYLTLGRSTIIN